MVSLGRRQPEGSGVFLNFSTLLIHYNGRVGVDGGGGFLCTDGGGEERLTEEEGKEEGCLTP